MDTAVSGYAELSELQRVLDYPTSPVATEDVQVLISTVDELLRRIDATADSELGRLGSQTRSALAAARMSVAANAAKVREEMGGLAKDGGAYVDYVREQRLVTLGTTALFALAIGLWVGRSTAKW